MLIVISPSKTQNFEKSECSEHTIPVHLEDSLRLVKQLRLLNPGEIASLMKTGDKISKDVWGGYQNFQYPFSKDNSKQALFSFTGEQYNMIDVENYSAAHLAFAQKHLRILSGLYGLLKPLDLIQPYRLEMGAKFKVEAAKNLYEFWRNKITESINCDLKSSSDPVLLNLASNEYYKSIDTKKLEGRVLAVSFKENKGGLWKVVGIYAKRARGLMVDFIVKNGLTDVEELRGFDLDGYKLNPDLSSSSEWVFCR